MKKFAIIGCGNIAKKHTEILGKNLLEDAHLVAVCDFDEQKLNRLSSEYDVPGFQDYNEMAKKISIDFFVILTPSGSHAKIILDLAPFKKNFIVEKPLSLTLKDISRVESLTRKYDCGVFVLMQNRFNKPIAALKKLLSKQAFGSITTAAVRMRWSRSKEYYESAPWRGTWKDDGGALTNQGIHFIDLLIWLIGDIRSVFAYSSRVFAPIEAEDTVVAVLKFNNGAIGTIECTTASQPKDIEGSLSILGSKGNIDIGGFSANNLIRQEMIDQNHLIPQMEHSNPKTDYPFAHKQFYSDVMIKSSTQCNAFKDCGEAKSCMETIHAIYESIETGREVFIGQEYKHSQLGIG